MKRLMILASLAATLLSQAATAGEISLFTREGFQGQQVTLRDGSSNFVDLGINDRVSSMIVHSGQWEVCEHRDFQGACAVFGPGEYPRLARFDNSISSAREVGRARGDWRDRQGRDDRYDREDGNWQGGQGGAQGGHGGGGWQGGQGGAQGGHGGGGWQGGQGGGWQGGQGGAQGGQGGGWQGQGAPVELFDGDNLTGRAIGISGDVRTLNDVGFNDHANSMIIREGTWELCEHADFRGQCFVFGPGRYPYLPNLRDRLSSLRRVR